MGRQQCGRTNNKQDRQCTCNITSRRVRVTIDAEERQEVFHVLSVCLYPYLSSMQCECAVIYCHLWPVRLYNIFPNYLMNCMTFGINAIEYKM